MPGREIETRVLIVAEMLDRAVAELKRLADEMKGTVAKPDDDCDDQEQTK